MNFRPDINGLRAIAVMAVVFFHFHIKGFQGGFVGVDVFFVISGYLMTGIISTRLASQQFSLLGFYVDRAKRIIPALFAMCATLLAVGWFVLFPSEYKNLAKYAVGALTFTSNIVFAKWSNYFDSSPQEQWLLHTWSLSVEWQFYMVYPIVVALLRKHLSLTLSKQCLVGLTLASLGLSVFVTAAAPTNAFYLLPTRAWEMLAGGLVFLYPMPMRAGAGRLLELAGLAMIALSLSVFSPATPWPGFPAALPVLGAALILLAGRTSSAITGNPLAQRLGKASYSIYLWHWPIVVGLGYSGHANDAVWIALAIALSLALGELSKRWIESIGARLDKAPAPSAARKRPRRAMLVLAGMVVSVAATGAAIYADDGVPGTLRPINGGEQSKFIEKYAQMVQLSMNAAYWTQCSFYDADRRQPRESIDKSCMTRGGPGAVFLWGDSHAQALSTGLRALVALDRFSQVATSACMPALGPQTEHARASFDNRCDFANRFALGEIERLRPETVILAQRWQHEESDWDALAARLHAAGVERVILVGPLPAWKPSLPALIAKNHWVDQPPFLADELEQRPFDVDAVMKARYGASASLHYVSVIDAICHARACLTFVPNNADLMAFDYGHLTPHGSLYVTRKLFGYLHGG